MTAKNKVTQQCPKGALHLEAESNSPNGRGTWYARVPAEHTIEDVTDPAYFGAVAQSLKLRAGDVIDIEPEHGLWGTRLRVMAVIPSVGQVRTRENEVFRVDYSVKAPNGFSFEWDGNAARWTLKKGAAVVDGGFFSQDEAAAKAQELMREKAA